MISGTIIIQRKGGERSKSKLEDTNFLGGPSRESRDRLSNAPVPGMVV